MVGHGGPGGGKDAVAGRWESRRGGSGGDVGVEGAEVGVEGEVVVEGEVGAAGEAGVRS